MQVEKLSDNLVDVKKRHKATLANTTIEQAEKSGQSMMQHYLKMQTESVQMFLELGMSSDELSKVKRILNCKGYQPTTTNHLTSHPPHPSGGARLRSCRIQARLWRSRRRRRRMKSVHCDDAWHGRTAGAVAQTLPAAAATPREGVTKV
eukprot:3133922-Pyramimonas_sp.AAC.1